jgi:hypothetical protein
MILGALCLMLTGCLAERKVVVSGVLHGDLIWQGDVLVAGDVVLEEDVKLTILPGTRVRFMAADTSPGNFVDHPNFPGNELIIKGQIYAVGTPSEPIIFEADDPDATAGFWGAINLVSSKEAVFEYCIFRQADSAIHSWDSQVYIEQSLFEDNLVGIRFNESEILIERNLLKNNHTGIRFHFGSPVICENKFVGNNVNLFVTSYPRDYHIENNSFGVPAEYHVVLGENVPEDVNLQRNFWLYQGDASIEQFFYDGRRSPYIGRTLIEPSLTTLSSQVGLSWNP